MKKSFTLLSVALSLFGLSYVALAAKPAAEKLDLNTATAKQLTTLPHIGPKKAEAIIAYRTELHGFSSLDQLDHIKGLNKKNTAALADKIFIAPAASK